MSPFPTRPEQGIPALGVLLLLGCAVYVAALADILLTGSLGWGLGAVLVAGSVIGAARVVRRDLTYAVLAPPLAFAAGTLAVVPFTAVAHEEAFPLGTLLAFAGALGGGAPLLGSAVLAAAVLALVRWELGRRGIDGASATGVTPPTTAGSQAAAPSSADVRASDSERPPDVGQTADEADGQVAAVAPTGQRTEEPAVRNGGDAVDGDAVGDDDSVDGHAVEDESVEDDSVDRDSEADQPAVKSA